MDFSKALKAMRGDFLPGENDNSKKIARSGWNGRGMFIYIDGCFLPSPENDQHSYPVSSFIIMKTADGYLIPWIASQTDILAEDWEIVD